MRTHWVLILTFFIALMFSTPLLAKRFKGVKVQWLGHAAFKIVSPKGKVLLIDPWVKNPKAPSDIDLKKVDLILVTHGHFDHVGNAVEIAKRTGATVVCIFEVSVYLKEQGLKNVVGMNKGGNFRYDGITIRMVDAAHSSGISGEKGIIPGGAPAGYVIEFENGFKIYHTGDTGLTGSFDLIGDFYKPDLVLTCIGDFYTMGPKEAAYAMSMLKPKWIIPMHFGTFPILSGTPEAFRKNLPKEYKDKVVVLSPGEVAE